MDPTNPISSAATTSDAPPGPGFTPVRSGPTPERLARAAILTAVVGGFAIAFLWDGYIGYPRENARVLVETLGLPAESAPAFDPGLSAAVGQELASRWAATSGERGGATSGEPTRGPAAGPIDEALGVPDLIVGEVAYYLGPAGHIRVPGLRGADVAADWVDGPMHTETDLRFQRLIGYVLTALGLLSLGWLVHVATTRAELDMQGLRIRRRPPIPLDAMSGLLDRRADGGTLELEYQTGGETRRVALDGYVFKNRDEIVEAICRAKGFSSPLKNGPGGNS